MTENLLQGNEDDNLTIDPTKNYLTELVGEGKKFKTPEDLARGKAEADLLVSIQNKRYDDLRKDYLEEREGNQSRAKLEELIDKLTKQPLTSSDNTNANEGNDKGPTFDLTQIESLVSKKIQEQEVSKKQNDNVSLVKTKLKERFGDNFKPHVKEHIENLGLTEDLFNDLAKNHPTVLIKTLGLEQKQESFQSPPRSDARGDSFSPQGAKKRSWAYYQEVRKKDPNLYISPKIQNQMIDDYKILGRDFEDGDFHQ